MDTHSYEQNQHFERNRAIYVLSTVDALPLSQIAENFNLSLDEVKNAIALHGKYESFMK